MLSGPAALGEAPHAHNNYITVHLIDNNILFKGHSTPSLNKHYGFDTALMSELEREEPRTPEFYTRARKVFRDLGFKDELVSDQDCDVARWACEVVATRAARLSAIGMAAVIKKTGAAAKTTGAIQVGVDGRFVYTTSRGQFPHLTNFTFNNNCAVWLSTILTLKRECVLRSR